MSNVVKYLRGWKDGWVSRLPSGVPYYRFYTSLVAFASTPFCKQCKIIYNTANFLFSFFLTSRLLILILSVHILLFSWDFHLFLFPESNQKTHPSRVSYLSFSICRTTVKLSIKQIAFQNTAPLTDVLSKPLIRRLELLILLVKQYIYPCKCSEKERNPF